MACSSTSQNQSLGGLLTTPNHFSGCFPHLSLRIRGIMVSAVSQMLHLDLAPSGASTYHIVSTFHPRGLLNTSCYLSPFQLERTLCCILTFDPAKHAIPKWCTGRKWHIPMVSNRKKSRRWIWLTKWDKGKAHDTLIDWCTGREWPLNCMTVISAWWRLNMIDWAIEWTIELLYNSVKTGSQRVGDQMS